MTHVLLQLGVLVADQWRLERKLGEGAMSSVWEAESLRLGGRVAIKFLAHEHLADERVRLRFEREARAICKVRSQHVVQVLDHGVSHGVPFLVMELLEGEDLGRMLEREKTVSLTETASIVAQLCRGLTKAHDAGFVHRDIKPKNVFVIHENDGGHYVKLLDFGIAKQLDTLSVPLTQKDTILGTAHYLSPEQIETPQQVDQRADVWSVGVLAYHMLLGKLPFDAETWPELCARILAAELSPASVERPGLPRDLDDWFRSAIQPDREARFQTVQAASTALSGIARAHSTGVRKKSDGRHAADRGEAPPLRPAQLEAPGHRRRARLALAGLIAILTIAGGLLAWNARRSPVAPAVVQRAPSMRPAHAEAAPPAPAAPIAAARPEATEPAPETPIAATPERANASDVAPAATPAVATPKRSIRAKTRSEAPSTAHTRLPKDRGF